MLSGSHAWHRRRRLRSWLGQPPLSAGRRRERRPLLGQLPEVSVNGADDVGQGRLLPTTSVDQLAATLGIWMGLSDTHLTTVLPQIGNYSIRNLGFMGA